MPFLRRALHRADAETEHVFTRFGLLDLVLRLEPARGLVGRQGDELLGVDVVDRQVGSRLRERIVEVSLEARPVLLEGPDAELCLLLVSDALLRLTGLEELLRRLVTTLEVAVVGATDHGIGMQLDLAALADRLCEWLHHPRLFHLDPIEPQGQFGTDAVALPGFGKETAGARIRLMGTPLAEHEEAVLRLRQLQRDLEHLRLIRGARDLVSAADRADAARILRTELHEAAFARDAIHRGDADAQDVIARRPIGRELEDLAGVHIGVVDREKAARLGQGVLHIGPMMRHEMIPVAASHLLGMNRVGESKIGR